MSALASVSIDWKMLTPSRPEGPLEEQVFSRLVELNRLTRQTRMEEEREFADLGGRDPDRVIRLPSENKGGVREVYTKVCTPHLFHYQKGCGICLGL